VRKLLSQGGGERLLLLVDQFEEVFTMCRAESERAAFIENLLTAVDVETAGPTLVVITLRADFYAHCAQYPKLRSLLETHQVYMGQMEAAELRRAIEGPAHQEGYDFEPGLVDLMLRDIGAGENSQPEPGALPLLSHALLETWKRRADRTLTLPGYTEAGGVTGAIARTADRVLQGLDNDQRVIARRVFLRLTELGEGTQDTRRRAALSELFTGADNLPEIESVLHTLSDARLITTRKESIEIAHEALIREWPTLREWLEENREGLRAHRHLTEAALEWERLGGDPGELYRGARLAMALDWAQDYGSEMSNLEQEFLAASQEFKEAAEREKEAARKRELAQARRLANTQRQRALFLLGGLVVAVVLSLIAFTLRGQADQERHAALTAQAKAEELTRFARAGELSALGLTQLDDQSDLALLLSIEAYNMASTWETRENLFTAWQRSPDLARFLRGHSGGVLSVAWSKDSRLASGSSDNSVIIWDLESGQPVQILHGHTDIVNSIAWSADGRLASASKDRSIIIWDLESGEPAQNLVGHTNGVTSVAWSADGRLASGSRDQIVILWDLATGQPEQTMVGHTNAVNSVAWSLDGWLASASQDKSLIIWDIDSRRPTQTLVGHAGSVQSVAWSSDGRLASASRDNTVIVWDVLSSAGPDLESAQSAQTLQGHASAVDSVAWSQDGRLASASLDSTVIVWDLDAGQPDETFDRHESAVRSVSWSDDGRLASASADNTVIAWRPLASRNAGIAGGEAVQTLSGHGSPVYNVAWSKDGRLASGSGNGTLFIWDLDTGQPDKTLQEGFGDFGERGILALAWSGDGWLAYSFSRTVKVWDLDSELPDLELPGQTQAWALAWSGDGRLVSSSGNPGSRAIYVWDVSEMLDSNLETGEPSKFLRSDSAGSRSLAWSPDGRLASVSRDGTVVVWDLESEKPLHTLEGHGGVAWSADGHLASASADNTVIVWDLETGRPAITLSGHTEFVPSVAWSADGRLASGSKDGTVIIWDVSANDRLQSTANSELEGGEPFQIFRLHEGGVNSIAWSGDGRLASGSEDGTVKVWEADPEVWVAQNCARAGRNLTQAEWDQYFTGEPYRKTCPQWPEGE
jgi:WD40 repeat protein